MLLDFRRFDNSLPSSTIALLFQRFALLMPFRLRPPYFVEGWWFINQHSILVILVLDKALNA
jgi:hypothetical protein